MEEEELSVVTQGGVERGEDWLIYSIIWIIAESWVNSLKPDFDLHWNGSWKNIWVTNQQSTEESVHLAGLYGCGHCKLGRDTVWNGMSGVSLF